VKPMNAFLYTSPLIAAALGQIGEVPSGLSVYGPIGLVCLLLVYREEKTKGELKSERDAVREDNSKLREEMRGVTHQLKNLNRNILYLSATHGPASIRTIAEQELDRINQQDKND